MRELITGIAPSQIIIEQFSREAKIVMEELAPFVEEVAPLMEHDYRAVVQMRRNVEVLLGL